MNVPKFADKLYIEPNAPSVRTLKKNLRKRNAGKRVKFAATYLVCVREDGKFSMEIFRFNELLKAVYANTSYMIVGAAGSRVGAFELARRMVADFVTEDFLENNDFSRLKAYVLKKTEARHE